MSLAAKGFFYLLLALPAYICLGIVQWHVIMVAAPQWITLWWIAWIVSIVGGFLMHLVNDKK
jgi:hypothetical protein